MKTAWCGARRGQHLPGRRRAIGRGDPHGLGEDKGLVRRDGIAVLQLRDGVEWNPGQTAHLVVGIAANSDSHIAILRRLTRLIQDEARLAALVASDDPHAIARALGEDGATAPAAAPLDDLAHAATWTVDYPAGLHARPASAWMEAARAAPAALRVRHGADSADPRSLVSLLQLGLKCGDTITVSADGAQGRAAVEQFLAAARRLTAREQEDAARAAAKRAAAADTGGRGWQPQGTLAMLPAWRPVRAWPSARSTWSPPPNSPCLMSRWTWAGAAPCSMKRSAAPARR
jgi:phosphocarrier protein FPr